MADDIKSLVIPSVNDLAETVSTFIVEGTNDIVDFFTSETMVEILEVSKEIGESLSKAFKVISIIQKSASIPDKLFMNKMEKYLKGLIEIPQEKRNKYLERVGKKSLNKDSIFILNMLNRIEESSKFDMLLKLFEAKMDQIIDDNMYTRLCLLVDRTMYADLLYLIENITDDSFFLTTNEHYGLYGSGWLVFVGIDGGTATEDGGSIYLFSSLAHTFCDIITRYS